VNTYLSKDACMDSLASAPHKLSFDQTRVKHMLKNNTSMFET
jgi:hypothetical protein